MKTYYYIVDLDERGIYKAHVEEAETHRTIYYISNEDEDGNISPLWIVEDGFMKNTQDMDGLWTYLQESSLIPFKSKLIYKG